MDKKQEIETVIESLETILINPRIYFNDEFPPVFNFIRGFLWGARFLVINTDYYMIYDQIRKERGWEITAHHVITEMMNRGSSKEEIIKELLIMELEAWKRVLANSDTGSENKRVDQ